MREQRDAWRRLRQLAETVPLLDSDQERHLFALARFGDASAREQIVQSHMRLVLKIAARYQRNGLSPEDLVGEGVVGLLEALGRFDQARGVRFAGYAAWWVRARIGQYALANRRAVGVPSTRNARCVLRDCRRVEHSLSQRLLRAPSQDELAQAMGVSSAELAEVRAALQTPDISIEVPHVADETDSPEQQLADRQAEFCLQREIKSALGLLSARERAIVSEQYLVEDGRSLSQLGEAFGVSRQRLGQVLSNARAKLKVELVHVA
jgi:RNA polymerase sigma-32 factor